MEAVIICWFTYIMFVLENELNLSKRERFLKKKERDTHIYTPTHLLQLRGPLSTNDSVIGLSRLLAVPRLEIRGRDANPQKVRLGSTRGQPGCDLLR